MYRAFDRRKLKFIFEYFPIFFFTRFRSDNESDLIAEEERKRSLTRFKLRKFKIAFETFMDITPPSFCFASLLSLFLFL